MGINTGAKLLTAQSCIDKTYQFLLKMTFKNYFYLSVIAILIANILSGCFEGEVPNETFNSPYSMNDVDGVWQYTDADKILTLTLYKRLICAGSHN